MALKFTEAFAQPEADEISAAPALGVPEQGVLAKNDTQPINPRGTFAKVVMFATGEPAALALVSVAPPDKILHPPPEFIYDNPAVKVLYLKLPVVNVVDDAAFMQNPYVAPAGTKIDNELLKKL